MEGHADKRRCCHQSMLTFVHFALNIFIIFAVGFGWVHFSSKFDRLTQDNDRVRSYPVSSDKTECPCNVPDEDSRSEARLRVRREILSPIVTLPNAPTMEKELAQISKLEKLIKQYHPDYKDISCPKNYRLNPYTGTCFRYMKVKYGWYRAKVFCERDGEHLATFDTIESAAWFRNQQVAAGWGYHSWIGSMKENGTWEWYGRLKGPVNLGYWAPKQPSSKDHHLCMVTWMPYDYYWDDHPCTSEVFFACEKKI